MFGKILIANRGEIACRIMRTARRLGICTVAIYSDADRTALHVDEADEAYRVGPPPAAESYLDIEAIIAIAKRCRAEAVHPGYGFLSENPAFAEALERAGIVFIGPPAGAIRAMGLKDAAKALMARSGVPVVPGYHGVDQDPARLEEQAAEIGYPVLVKARAGGGGKGMRRVDDPADLPAALESARREAQSAFGDGGLLIEKYLTKPRHIEVQVFADQHGNVVHLFERDCSAQRRHQKVIEEAPAPGMTEEMRSAMGEAAVRAARAVGYVGAGTVEFIADVSEGLRSDRFFFMEMNTRLQVEHPVTEAVTGHDLVEWQLRVAAGEALPRTQADLAINGSAFEARIYAENPATGFLPATGRLTLFDPPTGVRVDTAVRTGDVITPFYDPLIAKVIVHGKTRRQALDRLRSALLHTHIAGLATNTDFLARLCAEPDFAAGNVDTGLIERALPRLVAERPASEEVKAIAAVAALGLFDRTPSGDPWQELYNFRLWARPVQVIELHHHGDSVIAQVELLADVAFGVWFGERTIWLKPLAGTGVKRRIDFGDRVAEAVIVHDGTALTVFLDGAADSFALPDPLAATAAGGPDADHVTAPMPGLVSGISAVLGSKVLKGDALVTMEAMKMELTLLAPRDGEIAEINVATGDQVTEGTVLVTFAEDEVAAGA